jgi:hypothetical protein
MHDMAREQKSGYSGYGEGQRRAYINILQACFQHLGVKDPVTTQQDWILERQEAIAQLRRICAEYGDNAWSDDLHLADILEKHLYRYLEADDRGEGSIDEP